MEKSQPFIAKAMKHELEFKEKIDTFKTAWGDEYLGYAAFFWQTDKKSAKGMILKGLRFCPDHTKLIMELSAILTKDLEEIESPFEVDNIERVEQIINQWIEIFNGQSELTEHLPPKAMSCFYRRRTPRARSRFPDLQLWP